MATRATPKIMRITMPRELETAISQETVMIRIKTEGKVVEVLPLTPLNAGRVIVDRFAVQEEDGMIGIHAQARGQHDYDGGAVVMGPLSDYEMIGPANKLYGQLMERMQMAGSWKEVSQ